MALVPETKEQFINPYNFVPMTDYVDREQQHDRQLSGYISYRIYVKDKLLMPERTAESTDNKFDFFKVKDKSVIPGSELRGCIRSVFETVTPSCFSVINDNVLSERISEPSTSRKPGILARVDKEWRIYEAQYCNSHKKEDGDGFDIERTWQKMGQKPILQKTFFKVDEQHFKVCDLEDVCKLISVLEIYIKNEEQSQKGKQPNADSKKKIKVIKALKKRVQALCKQENADFEQSDKIPVFYEYNNGKLVYFSAAHTGRLVNDNTVSKLLGAHKKCSGVSDKYCPACTLFGTLGDNHPIASRVRFSDGVVRNNVTLSDYLVIPELASPKISSVEFYTKNNKTHVEMWDYDSDGVELRGRKYYFHSAPRVLAEDEFGKRQIKTRAVEKGGIFSAKLFFDSISEVELRELLWAISLGENTKADDEAQFLHKLGAGKPVGFGSVKMTVEKVVLRNSAQSPESFTIQTMFFCKDALEEGETLTDYNEYVNEERLLQENSEERSFFNEKAVTALKLITNYHLLDKYKNAVVSYPLVVDKAGNKNVPKVGEKANNELAAHQWFRANRRGGKFNKTLPELSSLELALPIYTVVTKQNRDGAEQHHSSRASFKRKGSEPRMYHDAKKKGFDFGKFNENDTYSAVIYEVVNKAEIEILVSGEIARVNKQFLPDHIAKDIEAAKKNATEFKVIFKGKNKNGSPRFFVPKQH